MPDHKGKAYYLKAYPEEGLPARNFFELRDYTARAPQAGEVQFRTIWMSVDPYMRARMRPNVKSYVASFALDAPLDGDVIGEVLESQHQDFVPGDYVAASRGGWRDYATVAGEMLTKLDPNDPMAASLSAYLGVLGWPGLTAWSGLTQILKPQAGETLFVSGAAGAVGSLVCQLGKLREMRVIASAGSPEKCRWLEEEAGADVALNYKKYPNAGALTKALAAAAPKGVDCYFENVGGMHLEAALNCINQRGRIALCGLISEYNDTAPEPRPRNLFNLTARSALMQGFIVTIYDHLGPQFMAEVAPLLASGKIKFKESVYEGLERAPDAFLGLFAGENFGKAVVRVGPDRI